MAKKARVLLEWTKSISTDVVEQRLTITLSNDALPLINTALPATVEQLEIVIPEKKLVHVEIKAFDGTNLSEPATLDFEIGDLTAPKPVTDLVYTVIEVFDDEEPVEDTTPLA